MKRLVPYPLLSFCLLVAWLLLNERLAVADTIVGVMLSLAFPWVLFLLLPAKPRLRRPGVILGLAFRVFVDIVRSNIAVAVIIFRPDHRAGTAGFVTIPLELRDPYGLAVLACIITATPGTLWGSLDPARGILVLHILDVIDEGDWVRIIKDHYERPLLEIFA